MGIVKNFSAIFLLCGALSLTPCEVFGASDSRPLDSTVIRAQTALSRQALGLQTDLPLSADNPMRVSPSLPDVRLLNNLPNNLADMANIMLWVALFAGVAVILFNLKTNLWSYSRSRRMEQENGPDAAPAEVAARMGKARANADELAAQGNFAEAMHVLLLQSVAELRRRLDISIAISLTSREILRAVGLSSEQHACFADIISRVELVYFGERATNQDMYLQCRRSFEGLTVALGGEGAA